MPDLPKQELDELFREGAGMQKFEYNEAAWDKMEGKLDNDDRNRRIGIWLLLLVGLALVVIAGLYYTSIEKIVTPKEVIYASENANTNSSSTQNQITQNEVAVSFEENVEKGNGNTQNEIAIQPKVVAERQLNAAQNSNNISRSTEINTNIYTEQNTTTNQDYNTLSDLVNVQNESANNAIVLPTTQDVNPKISEVITESKELISFTDLQREELSIFDINSDPVKNNLSPIDVQKAIYEDQDNGPSVASRLSYTVFAAPEWSSVGANGPREMGYKFGAKLGFQLSDKFELATGLSISQKKFNGEGSEFTLTEGWVNNIMPMTMEAKCNIIEIPLDLNYHFNGVGDSGFVAGIGLRSFMLHSEWYGFEYNVSQIGLVEEIVTDNTQNKNWVGSIELSLGYNKKVNDNLSVQIVPYLQIPATGIGEGKVDLYSGGVQFAVRFDGK